MVIQDECDVMFCSAVRQLDSRPRLTFVFKCNGSSRY